MKNPIHINQTIHAIEKLRYEFTYQTTDGSVGEGIATLQPFPYRDVAI